MSAEPGARASVALGLFERWSNYLLVATVAAAGWAASDKVVFASPWYRSFTLWCLGLSIVFAIFTLASIPLLFEQSFADPDRSIYKTEARFKILGREHGIYLTQVCRPQHLTFIGGVLAYCLGTTFPAPPIPDPTTSASALIPGAVTLALALLCFQTMRPKN